jgi:copper(I)-binding protein
VKSAVLTGIAILLAGAGVAGCQQRAEQPAPEASESAPEAPAGIAVSNGRLVLPAVKGNPGAVYFDVVNNGNADSAIAGVSVEGAQSAMLHTTTVSGSMASMEHMDSVPLAKGATISFAPGGNHVMAMDLSDTLMAGTSTEVTLTFANGDKASFPAQVRAPGDAD